MRKFLLSSALVVASAIASPALAAESVTAPITFTGGTAAFSAEKTSSGTFTDIFTFNLGSSSIGSGSLITIALLSGAELIRDIDLSSVTISGPQGSTPYTLLSSGDQVESYALLGVPLLAGLQTITISGNVASQSGSYAGTFNILPSAVPEPTSWAFMLLGFSAVGYSLRTRKGRRGLQAV